MTFARVYGTGSGALRFRLSIEGWPYEFVTSSSMEATAADGRVRVVGLSVEGAKISQRADLVRSTLEAQGMSVKIADVAIKATLAFSLQPAYTTWLASVAAASASTLEIVTFGSAFALAAHLAQQVRTSRPPMTTSVDFASIFSPLIGQNAAL